MPEYSRARLLGEFANVLALYFYFRSQPQRLQQPRFRGEEVDPLGLDFICDVEIKAKRALTPVECGLFLRMAQNEKMHRLIAEPIRLKLAEAWLNSELGTDGQYRRLFFLAKRSTDLASMPKRVITAADDLDEYFPDTTHPLDGGLSDDEVASVFSDSTLDYFGEAA